MMRRCVPQIKSGCTRLRHSLLAHQLDLQPVNHCRGASTLVSAQRNPIGAQLRAKPQLLSSFHHAFLTPTNCQSQLSFASSTKNDKTSMPKTPKEKTAHASTDDPAASNESPSPSNNTVDARWDRYVYVHPLSQIILEFLQDHHHGFLERFGLTLLRLHRDGSFELLQDDQKVATNMEGSSASSNIVDITNSTGGGPPNSTVENSENTASSGDAKPNHSVAAEAARGPLRIWTSYDEMEKKHWLTVQHTLPINQEEEPSGPEVPASTPLYRRFLLQDNLLPAWHGNRSSSLPSRVQGSVQRLLASIAEDSNGRSA